MAERKALRNYKFETVDDNDIDYELPTMNQVFSTNINTIPIQNAVQGARLFYGARFTAQAVPTPNREAPLVQNLDETDDLGSSIDDKLGTYLGVIKADDDGFVRDVNDREIIVEFKDKTRKKYPYYNNFPLNRKTAINNILKKKKGDAFKKGEILATSNYTDDNGTLALGVNARIGVVPYKGYSLDDAIVISDSFAKRLSADTLTTHDIEYKRGVKGGKAHYVGLFTNKFNKNQLEKLDDEGVIKPGTIVEKGDPIILATAPKVISAENVQLGNLSSHMKNARRDSSEVWHYDSPGEVTDVRHTPNGVRLNIKSVKPTQVSDKITLRTGQKSIVSLIVPDEEMPRTEDGKPLEVLLNPLSMPSRVNNSLVYELLLGKIAAKTGKPYKLPGFNKKGEKWHEFVEQELKKHGIVDKERVYDPKLDKWLQNPITVGNAYILKLHHMGEAKLSARGQGGYTADRQPSKGGEAGGKRMSNLEVTGLLSSGATNILREGSVLRGDENTDYWMELRKGGNPKLKNNSFAWDKFRAMLTGAGFHTNLDEKTGNMRIGPVTDRILDQLKSKEIGSAETLDIKTLHPIKGGLFDDTLSFTNSWGHISLDHPVPNPAFEDSIRKLLNLKEADLRDIIAGKKDLPPELVERIQKKLKEKRASTVSFPTTGPEAISEALNALDMDELEAEANLNLKTSKKTLRTDAVRKLSVLKGLRRNGLTPSELMLKKVPVIPTRFRPFNVIGETIVLGDVNELYRDLINLRDTNRQIRDTFGDKAYNESKLQAYDAVKATFGFGDPTEVKTKQRGVSGLLGKITGKGGAKFSYPQRNLLSKTQDFTGRGVIVVDPELSMDEIAIPEAIAWTTFAPHVQRRMVRQGMSPANAVKMIKEQNDTAKRYLEEEMREHPVMYSRAPAWHKFNSAGAYAKITEGHAIKVSPYICTSQNADFDGNCCISTTYVTIKASFDLKNLQNLETCYNNTKGRFGQKNIKIHVDNIDEITKDVISLLKTSNLYKYMINDSTKVLVSSVETADACKIHVTSDIQIKDTPCLKDVVLKDKNGADVYQVPDNLYVLSYDVKTGNTGWYQITGFTYETDCSVVDVGTARNKSLTVSDNESLAVYAAGGKLVKMSPEKAVGCLIPSISTVSKHLHKTTTPTGLGWVIGAFASDGFFCGDTTIGYSKTNQAFRERFILNTSEYLNTNVSDFVKTYSTMHQAESNYGISGLSQKLHLHFTKDSIGYSKLLPLLRDCYTNKYKELLDMEATPSDIGRSCLYKKLPDFIWTESYEFLCAVLGGLIDNDGSVSINNSSKRPNPIIQSNYTTSSESLRDDIIRLAHMLDVRANYSVTKPSASRLQRHDSYTIFFNVYDLAKILNLLSLSTKCEAIDALKENYENGSLKNLKDFVPVDLSFIRKLQAKVVADTDFVKKSTLGAYVNRASYHIQNQYIKIERSTAEKMLAFMNDAEDEDCKVLSQILSATDITWDMVESVSNKRVADVCDFIVPDTKVYALKNGIIIYDTMNIHVPSTPEAIDDVKNKIMPSKMLFNIKQHDSVAYPVTQEMILSLYSSQHKKGEPVSFATEQEAIKAIEAGNVPLSAEIQIGGMKRATVGEQEVEVENVTNSATFSDSNPKRLVSNSIKKTPLDRAKSTKGNAGRHINWTKLTKKNFNGVTRKFD